MTSDLLSLCAASVFVLASPTSSQTSFGVERNTKLNAPLVHPSMDVLDYASDPTGTTALYVADQDQLGVFELYAVATDQSAPAQKLSAPMPSFGDVQWNGGQPAFRLGPAGRVVYRADSTTDGTFELFSVPLDGSAAPAALCPPMTTEGVWSFQFSPDGASVVYLADQDIEFVYELFVVPADGSAAAQRIHAPLVEEQSMSGCVFDPAGATAAYPLRRATPQGSIVEDLFRAPLDGSFAPVLLGSFAMSPFSHGIDEIVFSPDGTWIAFAVSYEISLATYRRLYLVPADGSLAAREIPFTGQHVVVSPRFTADGSRVVFSVSRPFAAAQALYSVTLTGPSVALDSTAPGNVAWRLGPDGGTVYFGDPSGIYGVPADGSAPQTLLSSIAPAPDWYDSFLVSPDGQWIVFATSGGSSGSLRSVSTAGGPLHVLAANGGSSPTFVSGSTRVLYTSGVSPSVTELFLVRTDGRLGPVRVNDALPAGGTVLGFQVLGTDQALYRASQTTSGVYELFKAPLEPRGTKSGKLH